MNRLGGLIAHGNSHKTRPVLAGAGSSPRPPTSVQDALRFGERADGQPPAPVTAEQLLEARRPEDVGRSLWLAFNRVQANATQGGQTGRTAQGRRIRTRPIGSIDRSVNLNRALWVLAEEMRKLKT